MRLQIRATEAFIRRLDALAEARGCNRSDVIRQLVSEASPSATADLPHPPDRDELLRLLGEAARGGSASAMRQLLEEYRRDSGDAPRQGRTFTDELARRREAS